MPKGPRGEKRPADVIGAATRVVRVSLHEGFMTDSIALTPRSKSCRAEK